VSKRLERLQVTRVVVAHQMSTIRQADRTVVLKAGQVEQVGAFEGLASVPGLLRDVVRRHTLQTV